MPIPDYQTFMLPLLRLAEDGKEHSLREALDQLAIQFRISDEERRELLPSGRQPTLNNRVGWAGTYLRKAGLLESQKRGSFRITARGHDVLLRNPTTVDNEFLNQFEEFKTFRSKGELAPGQEAQALPGPTETPEETLEAVLQKMNQGLADELLVTIKSCSPAFFESLVVDVLVKMGYGGTRQDAGKAVGRSGDDGIDGIIKEDRLGLDIIYVQAKRWEAVVGRPEVQKFAGALQGQRAKKGIFLTTSSFSKEAYEYVSRIDSKIVLLDGAALAALMIDHNVGVSVAATYTVKRLDTDYFQDQ